jgi:hypothetical protein
LPIHRILDFFLAYYAGHGALLYFYKKITRKKVDKKFLLYGLIGVLIALICCLGGSIELVF